jgi:hypothetical protein
MRAALKKETGVIKFTDYMFWSLRHKKSLSYCMAWILIFCVRRALLFLLFHTFVSYNVVETIQLVIYELLCVRARLLSWRSFEFEQISKDNQFLTSN